jgi:hypothetical protein
MENKLEKEVRQMINTILKSFPKWFLRILALLVILGGINSGANCSNSIDNSNQYGGVKGGCVGNYTQNSDSGKLSLEEAYYPCLLQADISSLVLGLKKGRDFVVKGDPFPGSISLDSIVYGKFDSRGGSIDRNYQERIGWFYANLKLVPSFNEEQLSKIIGLGEGIVRYLTEHEQHQCPQLSQEGIVTADSLVVSGATVKIRGY